MGRYIYTMELVNAADTKKVIGRYDCLDKKTIQVGITSYSSLVTLKGEWSPKAILEEKNIWSPEIIGEFDTLDNPIEVLYG